MFSVILILKSWEVFMEKWKNSIVLYLVSVTWRILLSENMYFELIPSTALTCLWSAHEHSNVSGISWLQNHVSHAVNSRLSPLFFFFPFFFTYLQTGINTAIKSQFFESIVVVFFFPLSLFFFFESKNYYNYTSILKCIIVDFIEVLHFVDLDLAVYSY